ncbi:PQQ-binding-like beta-propeller repeat protein [Parendozoicomonas sp. Alg238-R29]|uniref:beta-alanine-activating enzyme beta-propeller domain-containing protein n=1 Tax=Parendozoicomonas sp. Alg238-R29 TaxID=2993446 RepID=UPI00248F15C4|nr:PQQ-binding-like beta-propeller repeat protein [Parendozoicomonas sp. Alg238-R29]
MMLSRSRLLKAGVLLASAASMNVALAAAGETLWSEYLGGNLGSTVAVAPGGQLYVGAGDYRLYALDPANNDKVAWRFLSEDFIGSSPAIGADGTVYVGSNDGKVYALNPSASSAENRVKWLYDVGESIYSSPAIGTDGTVYIGADNGKVYALNGQTGAWQWEFSTAGKVGASPSIAADGSLYIGSADGYLYALDTTAGGTETWRFQTTTGEGVGSVAVDANGMVFAPSQDGNVYAITPNGFQAWSYNVGSKIASTPVILENGYVAVVSYESGRVVILNPAAQDDTARLVLSHTLNEKVFSTPTVGADGSLIVATMAGKIVALDPNNSQNPVKWEWQGDSGFVASPKLTAEGTLHITSIDGTYYALDSQTGGMANTPWPVFGKNLVSTRR